jgi:hypothetical protein
MKIHMYITLLLFFLIASPAFSFKWYKLNYLCTNDTSFYLDHQNMQVRLRFELPYEIKFWLLTISNVENKKSVIPVKNLQHYQIECPSSTLSLLEYRLYEEDRLTESRKYSDSNLIIVPPDTPVQQIIINLCTPSNSDWFYGFRTD